MMNNICITCKRIMDWQGPAKEICVNKKVFLAGTNMVEELESLHPATHAFTNACIFA